MLIKECFSDSVVHLISSDFACFGAPHASLQDAIERGYLISTGKANEYAAGHMVDKT